MQNKTRDSSDRAWASHREEQILRMARESTAEQRLEWLEQMLKFLSAAGIDYNKRKRVVTQTCSGI